MPSFCGLPDSLINLVFSFVVSEGAVDFDSFRALQLTCKSFRAYAESATLWRFIPLKINNHFNGPAFRVCQNLGTGTEGLRTAVFCRPVQNTYLIKKSPCQTKDGLGVGYHIIRSIAIHQVLNELNSVSEPLINSIKLTCISSSLCATMYSYVQRNLEDFVEQLDDKSLQRTLILDIMRQLMAALEHCHRRGVAHRNVKPKHVLLSFEPGFSKCCRIQLADFAMARFMRPGYPARNYTAVVTSLWYRAPEILLGNTSYDFKIDVWSAGCVWAEIANSGVAIFRSNCEIEQLFQIFNVCGTPVEATWPGVSSLPYFICSFPCWPAKRFPLLLPEDNSLLAKMLCCDPAKRASAAYLHAAFGRLSSAGAGIDRQYYSPDIMTPTQSSEFQPVKRSRLVSDQLDINDSVIMGYLGQLYEMNQREKRAGVIDKSLARCSWIFSTCHGLLYWLCSQALSDNCAFLCSELLALYCQEVDIGIRLNEHIEHQSMETCLQLVALIVACVRVANKCDSVQFLNPSATLATATLYMRIDARDFDEQQLMENVTRLECDIASIVSIACLRPTVVEWICLYIGAIQETYRLPIEEQEVETLFALSWLQFLSGRCNGFATSIMGASIIATWAHVQSQDSDRQLLNSRVHCTGSPTWISCWLAFARSHLDLELSGMVPCLSILRDLITELQGEHTTNALLPIEFIERIRGSFAVGGFHWRQQWWTSVDQASVLHRQLQANVI